MSCVTPQAEFCVIRGVTFERDFHIKLNGVDVSLVGKNVVFGCRPNNSSLSVLNLSSAGSPTASGSSIAFTNQAGGQFHLKIADEDAALLSFNTGTWWVNTTVGGDVNRLCGGVLTVRNQ